MDGNGIKAKGSYHKKDSKIQVKYLVGILKTIFKGIVFFIYKIIQNAYFV